MAGLPTRTTNASTRCVCWQRAFADAGLFQIGMRRTAFGRTRPDRNQTAATPLIEPELAASGPGADRRVRVARTAVQDPRQVALVQMADQAEIFPIDMDTLSIEQDGIPDSERSGIFKPEHGEVELTLANTMHQFDA